MKSMATLLAGLLLAGAAGAGDVYVTTDAQGRTIYTDTPQTIPAQKLDVHTGTTEATAAPRQISPATTQPGQSTQANMPAPASSDQQAAQSTAEDKAKRCMDARQRYQTLMDNWRIYEPGPNGERTYLTSDQIDAARANAKQVMNEFCSDQ
jgi:hypothetical protein